MRKTQFAKAKAKFRLGRAYKKDKLEKDASDGS
jgi:hypothetical protein